MSMAAASTPSRQPAASTVITEHQVLAARVAPLGLGADVMTGFPGETDADPRATLALLRGLPFTYLHVFPYSPREGTAAPHLGAPPAPDVVRERGAELRALAAEREAAHRRAREGQVADLVVEGRRGGSHEAVSEDYLGVRIPTDAAWVAGRRRIRARLVGAGDGLAAEAA
jgi:threonylcarbamoyladenosine tRNA methylthiotransferase MtaB